MKILLATLLASSLLFGANTCWLKKNQRQTKKQNQHVIQPKIQITRH